jgi:hypothetical protein
LSTRHSREGGNPERPRALLKTFLQPLERFLDGPERPDHDGAGKLKILNDFSMGKPKERFRCFGMENMDEMTIPFLP